MSSGVRTPRPRESGPSSQHADEASALRDQLQQRRNPIHQLRPVAFLVSMGGGLLGEAPGLPALGFGGPNIVVQAVADQEDFVGGNSANAQARREQTKDVRVWLAETVFEGKETEGRNKEFTRKTGWAQSYVKL